MAWPVMMMGWMQSAEFYAIAVNAGDMTMDEVTKRLSADSKGGLTEEGARRVLRDTVAAARKDENAFDVARVALWKYPGEN